LITRETVAIETPANSATRLIVTRSGRRPSALLTCTGNARPGTSAQKQMAAMVAGADPPAHCEACRVTLVQCVLLSGCALDLPIPVWAGNTTAL